MPRIIKASNSVRLESYYSFECHKCHSIVGAFDSELPTVAKNGFSGINVYRCACPACGHINDIFSTELTLETRGEDTIDYS